MAIPENIKKVPRPTNTIVHDSGKDTLLRYSVIERTGVRYVPGGYPRPINGRTIGHIINGEFVPLEKRLEPAPEFLSYGFSALIRSVWDDLRSDLFATFSAKEAGTLLALASLRVMHPSMPDCRFGFYYKSSFISKYLPGISASKNSISALLEKVGMNESKRVEFFRKRLAAVQSSDHIAIDGTLVQDTSRVNDLSAFSYKARVRGTRDISILYAYDIEKMEPLCSQVFPGNHPDMTVYREFIRTNNLTKGIILADKGFPASQIRKELSENKDLHYLSALKRDNAQINKYGLLNWQGVLKNSKDTVYFSKAKNADGNFLYAFRNTKNAAGEDAGYGNRNRFTEFDAEDYKKKKERFGLIVFESDQDLPPDRVYECYRDRWQLELVFRAYKNLDEFDQTRVQGDFTVIGSAFVNFLSTVLTCRILAKGRDCGVLDDMSYGEMREVLNGVWRETPGAEPPSSDDDSWKHPLKYALELMEKLGLSKGKPLEKARKRGRPKTKKETPAEKRPRGRPRKAAPEASSDKKPKKAGRPKVRPEFVGPKRPRGRPRKL